MDQAAELIAATQRALVEGIRIPENDRFVRILEYPGHSFAAAPDRGPTFTIVEISMFAGRSVDAKRRLDAVLAREFAAFGVPARDLKVIVHDVPRENWGLHGQAGSDIELSFKVEV